MCVLLSPLAAFHLASSLRNAARCCHIIGAICVVHTQVRAVDTHRSMTNNKLIIESAIITIVFHSHKTTQSTPAQQNRSVKSTHNAARRIPSYLLHCLALRAFFNPVFLRSTWRASRLRAPASFRAQRVSGSRACSALPKAWRTAPACACLPPPYSKHARTVRIHWPLHRHIATNTHAHARAHKHTHTRAQAHAHTHTNNTYSHRSKIQSHMHSCHNVHSTHHFRHEQRIQHQLTPKPRWEIFFNVAPINRHLWRGV